jgi:predicted glycosyltransferase
MIRTTTKKQPHRKAKKSYSLSHESVQFLETMRKRRKASSISSILEDILQAVRRQQERAVLEHAVAGYYDSLSGAEAEELTAWGEFALTEFPNEAA